MSYLEGKIFLKWVILEDFSVWWLGLIFDFKGGYHTKKFILRTFFTATRENFCFFTQILYLWHKIWKFSFSKFFGKNDIFVISSIFYAIFMWTLENFFFDQKFFFSPIWDFVSFNTKFISEVSDLIEKFYVMTRVNFWF